MIRKTIFIAALTAAIALPTTASAHCSTMQGSFAVTCEKGVQVYRHQALSSIPRGLSAADVSLKTEAIRAKTARAQIAAQSRAQAANVKLRQRELAIADYNARVNDRNTRRRSSFSGFGGGFGYRGFNDIGFSNAVGSPFGGRSRGGNRGRSFNRNTRNDGAFNGRRNGNAGVDLSGNAVQRGAVQTSNTTTSRRASGSRLVSTRLGGKSSGGNKKH
jgi:hypothetical protein